MFVSLVAGATDCSRIEWMPDGILFLRQSGKKGKRTGQVAAIKWPPAGMSHCGRQLPFKCACQNDE
jgi:hypothetical protein